nr:hypothetical protein Iba_chr08cCG0370 [Ipomoea batatas]
MDQPCWQFHSRSLFLQLCSHSDLAKLVSNHHTDNQGCWHGFQRPRFLMHSWGEGAKADFHLSHFSTKQVISSLLPLPNPYEPADIDSGLENNRQKGSQRGP